tara:strand:+ start:464 stop:772 length:309 start_codon:yes stop_codon:yes gene_type:complete
MNEQQKQEIIQELKEYIDSILKPIDNEKVFPLKYVMMKYDLSQDKVASDLGVSLQTIHRWIHNKSRISDVNISRLEKLMYHYQMIHRSWERKNKLLKGKTND